MLYICFSHERDATSHISKIAKIDKMSDGSFWLLTGSGSVYRLEVVSEVEAKTEETPVEELCDQSHDGAEGLLGDEDGQ